ncbi:related to apopolysialoglycoprotein [Fusarium torulosum]|uniref:Related to apopolysialoglycoprotein n=1 Tax=Fusarium torulosum TaxID=33205 RepID=A0AAE8MD17_9HYPO|nr:related to apopolysialoglycoprotein [Fusarium torulosum]
MAPGTRRANRSGYAEHDDFEGLPVRQWRQEWISVAPPQQQEQTQQNDIWSIDLPHGMPKDSHLLPAHSQELLAAARSGRLYKRPAPAEEEEADADAAPEKPEKKEEDISARGFSVKVWKQLPRNIDTASTSHLAKRQKNTVTIASRTFEERVQGPTVTRATVRRVDAAGNPYTEEVTLSDGQPVQGEIVSTRIEPAPTRGTEPLATTPVPNRRRPPPPKRKAKAGPGRGKKKIKNPPPEIGAAPVAPVAGADGAAPAAPVKPENPAEAAIKQEREDSTNQDSPMLDADDDDDEDGDDDEGDEGEEGDGTPAADSQANVENNKPQDHEMTDAAATTTTTESAPIPSPAPAPAPAPAAPPAALGNDEPDVVMQNDSLEPVQSPANLVPPTILTPEGSRPEGSPLKNVLIPSPTKEVDQEQLLKEAIDASLAGGNKPQEPELTEENLAEALRDPTGEDEEPHFKGLDEEDILQAAVNAPFAPGQQLAVGPGAEPAGSTVAEPPSTIVGEAPEVAADRDVPMLEPTDSEALLPPPPEEVGNIATTPPGNSGEPSTSVPGSDTKPSMDIQAGEEAVPQRPLLAQNDTGLTEDSIRPDDSASITAPMSDITDVAAVAPSVVEPPPEPAAETTIQDPAEEETKQPTPPQPEIKEESAPPGEEISRHSSPDLLDSLMNKLDRQSAESERKKQEESSAEAPEPLPEAVPQVPEVPTEAISEPPTDLPESIPEPPAAPVVEPTAEFAPEPAAETATEPTVESTTEPAAEVSAEPIAESLAEPVSEVPPESTLIPTEAPEGPGDEAMVTEGAEPADPVLEAPEVEKPTEEAPAVPGPAAAEEEQSEQPPKQD